MAADRATPLSAGDRDRLRATVGGECCCCSLLVLLNALAVAALKAGPSLGEASTSACSEQCKGNALDVVA